MRKINFTASILCLFLLCSTIVRAEDSIKSFYVEPFIGFHAVPGFLLGFEADTYPKGGLKGHAEGLRFGYNLSDKYSLGATLFHSDVSGSGPWGQNAEAKAHGVDGQARGTVDLGVSGIGIEGARRFRLLDSLAVVTRLGLGVGYVDVNFDGSFHGHVIMDPSITIDEPAHEHRHRVIPVVGLGASLEWHPTQNVVLSVGPYWNTGFGAETSLKYLFDF